jgi:hypothetical protein
MCKKLSRIENVLILFSNIFVVLWLDQRWMLLALLLIHYYSCVLAKVQLAFLCKRGHGRMFIKSFPTSSPELVVLISLVHKMSSNNLWEEFVNMRAYVSKTCSCLFLKHDQKRMFSCNHSFLTMSDFSIVENHEIKYGVKLILVLYQIYL